MTGGHALSACIRSARDEQPSTSFSPLSSPDWKGAERSRERYAKAKPEWARRSFSHRGFALAAQTRAGSGRHCGASAPYTSA